ncbi:MAG: hypothetical protein HY718_11945 [Planctomycetes bacterium]|nr:hypothetical protein [Planctomycetota bacterium]
MKVKGRESTDLDIIGSFAALKRAARRARELGRQTGTPVYVMIKGKMVDLTERDARRPSGQRKQARR